MSFSYYGHIATTGLQRNGSGQKWIFIDVSYSCVCTSHIGSWQLFGFSGPRIRMLHMDFQLARNLSALTRAQQEAAQALLHIDSLADCINREIVMSAASSEATEQLVASARSTLIQVQQMLSTQSDEGARRLVRLKFPSSLRAEHAPPVHQRLTNLSPIT